MFRWNSAARHGSMWLICAAAMLVVSARSAQAQYTAVDLYTLRPPAGYVSSGNQSVWLSNVPISATGQVVGSADDQSSVPGSSIEHTFLWTPSGTRIDLGANSFPGGTNGSQQVGGIMTDSGYYAVLWNGRAASMVNLNPAGFAVSAANATSGTQQVGYATDANNVQHAMLWSGTAASAVDLSPSGSTGSQAMFTDGTHQVGNVFFPNMTVLGHAFLWSGTAASGVDLNPAGADASQANGVGGNQQVGLTLTNGVMHGVLWTGTAASAVDLQPTNLSGFVGSNAVATNGRQQVGDIGLPPDSSGNSIPHAAVWSGTANSAVDLHQSLNGSFSSSIAEAIDGAGDVLGVAVDSSSNYHAIEWVAPPHTATASVAGGTNQSVSVAGRSPTAGDVRATFQSATSGTLSNVSSLSTGSELAAQTAPLNFVLSGPGGMTQSWDLSFSGTFTGQTSLTFHYDPAELADGITPSDLRIEHFTGGQWVLLTGMVDPSADTIMVSTDSLSPFALAAVPEPSAAALFFLAAAATLLTRRRGFRM